MRFIQKIFFHFFTIIARVLPRWKEAPFTDIVPPILSLPVALPANVDQLPQEFAKQFVSIKSIPKQRVFILKKVFANKDAVVFKNFRVFLPSLPWANDLNTYRNGRLLLKQWLSKKTRTNKSEVITLVFDHWAANNYYHWIIESLPRLLVALSHNPHSKIFVPQPAPAYIFKTLELLGCQNLIPLKRNSNKIWSCTNLLLPQTVYYENSEDDIPPIYNGHKVNRQEIRYDVNKIRDKYDIENQELIIAVKNRILDKLAIALDQPQKRIYVSRARQKTRRLMNEHQILPLLKLYGFEIICFEDFDFEAQVRLMQQAEIFMGVHGANMVNILFMKQGAKVIEFMNLEYVNDAYYQIASSVHLPYYSVPCQMTNNLRKDVVHFSVINDADIIVDIAKLEDTLKYALSV